MFYTDLNRNGFSVFSLNKILALGSGYIYMGPPWWLSGKESTCNAGDMGLIPGWGRSPREGNSNLLQYSCLGNPMDRSLAGHSIWGCKRVGYNLAKQQQHISIYYTKNYSFIPIFLNVYIMNKCWILSKAFSAFIDIITWFCFLRFINMVYDTNLARY